MQQCFLIVFVFQVEVDVVFVVSVYDLGVVDVVWFEVWVVCQGMIWIVFVWWFDFDDVGIEIVEDCCGYWCCDLGCYFDDVQVFEGQFCFVYFVFCELG